MTNKAETKCASCGERSNGYELCHDCAMFNAGFYSRRVKSFSVWSKTLPSPFYEEAHAILANGYLLETGRVHDDLAACGAAFRNGAIFAAITAGLDANMAGKVGALDGGQGYPPAVKEV